ncbi:MAG: methyltransferase domain-containing protein [Gammaproteobacteria bacterium]|nr:methyltransferase domain-containing protein [Gammaproteobacteria bacterium]MDH3467097.1 methyltransferase domain-containing protein [Gammaproteobacteria bacterium]
MNARAAIDYDHLAADYANHRTVNPEVVRSLISDARLTTESRVLEIGCGTANYTVALHVATQCQCSGIDPSPEMLRRASKDNESISLQPGRAEQLEFPGARFDLVFSVDVIHHVEDRGKALQEAYRVLAPHGRLCTVTDSASIIRNRQPLAAYFPDTIDIELSRYPSVGKLKVLMGATGFVDIGETTVECSYSIEDIQAYRDKAFSSLHYISERAFRDGIKSMERDLKNGPIPCASRYTMLWGRKPAA